MLNSSPDVCRLVAGTCRLSDVLEKTVSSLREIMVEKGSHLLMDVSPELTLRTDDELMCIVLEELIYLGVRMSEDDQPIHLQVYETLDEASVVFRVTAEGIQAVWPQTWLETDLQRVRSFSRLLGAKLICSVLQDVLTFELHLPQCRV